MSYMMTPGLRWTRLMERRLAELLEENPCLWNPTLINQLKCGEREEIYQSIAAQIGESVTEEDVKYKFRYYKSYFNKEKRKIIASKLSASTQKEIYTPTWHLFSSLQFFDCLTSQSVDCDSIDQDDDVVEELSNKQTSPEITIVHDETIDSGFMPTSSFDLPQHHHQSFSVLAPAVNIMDQHHSDPSCARKRIKVSMDESPAADSNSESVRQHIIPRQHHLLVPASNSVNNSSCAFGNYVGERLTDFDDEQRNWAMFKISEVLFKASQREFYR